MSLLRSWLQRRRDRHDTRVLTVLLVDREPMHGWQLTQASGLSAPAVYLALERLRVAELVDVAWEDVEGNPPRRHRMYRLTEAGRQHARQLLAPPPRPRP